MELCLLEATLSLVGGSEGLADVCSCSILLATKRYQPLSIAVGHYDMSLHSRHNLVVEALSLRIRPDSLESIRRLARKIRRFEAKIARML